MPTATNMSAVVAEHDGNARLRLARAPYCLSDKELRFDNPASLVALTGRDSGGPWLGNEARSRVRMPNAEQSCEGASCLAAVVRNPSRLRPKARALFVSPADLTAVWRTSAREVRAYTAQRQNGQISGARVTVVIHISRFNGMPTLK